MGWKNVKDHYRIDHIVHVTEQGICIGSQFINDLIVIGENGKIVKPCDVRCNEDLLRYQREMESDPGLLRNLVAQSDQFSRSNPVYTYCGSEIIEKLCEDPGWPNVTHDGQLMCENTYSTDKRQVISWAKRNAASGVRVYRRRIADAEQMLQELRTLLAEEESVLAKLEEDYPNSDREEDEDV